MEPQEIIHALISHGPWVSDAEEGVYCFYCGCTKHETFHRAIYTHEKNCIWLEIEKYNED